MNQRSDTPGGDYGERGRETNGGQEQYSGRPSQMQSEDRERWHGGFERSPSQRQESRSWNQGNQGPSESDRYRPVTEEWEAARGYGDMGRESDDERYSQGGGRGYGGQGRYGQGGGGRYGREGQYGQGGGGQSGWRQGGGDEGRYSSQGGGWGRGGYGAEGRGRDGSQGGSGRGEEGYSGAGRYGRGDWGRGQGEWGRGDWGRGQNDWSRGQGDWSGGQGASGRSQSDWSRGGQQQRRGYWTDRPSSGELFGRSEDTPHYYGTGSPGWGGPGFTGGAYSYGDSTRYQQRPLESEYSDESSVGYEGSYRQGYRGATYRGPSYGSTGAGSGMRQRSRGPKGYQRSDERLKEDISERLMEAYDIDSSEVTVEVSGAKVTLEGSVPSRHMKHAIEDLVDACPGVQDIENRVRVASPNYQGSSAGSTGTSLGTSSGSQAGSGASGATSTSATSTTSRTGTQQSGSQTGTQTKQ
jgi:BON domain-containing protein